MKLRNFILLSFVELVILHGVQAQIISCDFEDDADPMCGFYNVDTDDANYKRSTGRDSGFNDASPLFDHTYGNETGHFLDTDMSTIGRDTKIATVFSPTVALMASSKICLQFYYHMYGSALDSLHVYKKQASVVTSVYNDTGNIGDFWKFGEVTIDAQSGSIQVFFEATISWGLRGDIALDDIRVTLAECSLVTTPGPPTTPRPVPLASYECTFDDLDQTACRPKQSPRNDFDWLYKEPGIQPNPQSPVYDHTTSTSAGLYMYVPQDDTQTEAEVLGVIQTPLLQAIFTPWCMEFYYYMQGVEVGTLDVFAVRDGYPPPISMPWNKTGAQDGYWNRGLVDIYPTFANYRVAFEASRKRGYRGSIAVDDLNLMQGRCPAEELKCDFEYLDICHFTQDRTDDMDWILGNGGTGSFGTGPSNDHTYGNSTGFYMYIEASSPTGVGHVARLISPPFTETHGHAHCLIFWYHMYGNHIDALNVLIANTTTLTQRQLIWSLAGNRGDKWRAAEVHVSSALDFVIIFEAFRGTSYEGDIAIDDLWLTSTEGCPGEAGLKNFSSISCDFEEIEVCYWQQDSSDDFDWVWQNGANQQLANTGPNEDHTTGSQLGFYMYIMEDYMSFPGGKARLMSPEAKAQTAASCLEFWYHMYGRDIESLSVYMQKISDADLSGDPIWTMSGNQQDAWHRATVNLPITSYAFKFVFEGTRGQSYRDNIALDDVMFYEGQNCPPFTTDAPVPTTTPTPVSTANCDFEDTSDTLCGYSQSIYDEMDWSFGVGSPIPIDHTLGTTQGHYLYVDSRSYYLRNDDRADLYSPLLQSSTQPQCLEFYYYMTGYNTDFLVIYFAPWGESLSIDPQFSLYGDQGAEWKVAQLTIPPMDKNFQVVFEAMFGYYSDVGIDDIKFTSGVCQKPTAAPSPLDGRCDFENGLDACGFDNVKFYDFIWRLNSGETATKGTGPSVDHTTGTKDGSYMYIESSLPQRPDDVARIISPELFNTPGNSMCMVFYYHMFGRDVGKIKVYSQNKLRTTELLSLSGNSGDMWQPAAVDLTQLGDRFQIIFEGVVGYSVNGDVAIDDISVRREPCPGFSKRAEVDFEMPGELNGFQQLSQNMTQWTWYDSRVLNTFPEKGDGSFMYIDGQSSKPGSAASILSPLMAGHATEHCIDFDYALLNDDTGKLLVTVVQKNGLPHDLIIRDGRKSWTHERKTVTRAEVGEEFMIFFTGQVGFKSTGYIAVDNLLIREKACNDLATPGTQSGLASSGGSVATAVILTILLSVVISAAVVGGVYYYRRRVMTKSIPSVQYHNRETDENNDIKDKPSLGRDLTIDNPNYENAILQSNA